MRALLLASASFLLIGGTALAQSSNSPLSNSATHTGSMNTKGEMAPRLPVSADEASADVFLGHAQTALRRGRTGEAQEALERAETRLLSRSTVATQASMPDTNPKVASIEAARQALGRGDRKMAMQSIQDAMAAPMVSMAPQTPGVAAASPEVYVGPGPASGVKPGTLGGIATGVGSPGGTGAGSQSRPQASFGGSTDVPPNSVAGIATSVGSPNGTGADSQPRPQASFGSAAVPPNTVAGIATSVGSPGGTGAGSQSRPQASFSGPATLQVVVPPAGTPAATSP